MFMLQNALFTRGVGNFIKFTKFSRLNLFMKYHHKTRICEVSTLFMASTNPFILFLARCYCYHPSFDAHIAHANEHDMQNAYK